MFNRLHYLNGPVFTILTQISAPEGKPGPSTPMIFLFAFPLLALLFWLSEPFGPQLQDRYAFWVAAKGFIHGVNPYDPVGLLELGYALDDFRMTNQLELVWGPPFILLLFSVFGIFDFQSFLWVHLGFVVLGISTCVLILFRHFAYSSRHQPRFRVEAFYSLTLLTFAPFFLCLVIGPADIFCLLGLSGFIVLRKERSWKSQFLGGLALSVTAIKPHLLFLLYFLILLEARKLSARGPLLGLIVGLTLLSLSTSIYFPQVWSLYLSSVGEFPILYLTPTVGSWLVQLFDLPSSFKFIFVFIGVLGIAVWSFRNETSASEDAIAFVILLSLIFAPYLWVYDYILLLPVILILGYKTKNRLYFTSLVVLLNLGLWFTMQPSHNAVWYPFLLLSLFSYSIFTMRPGDPFADVGTKRNSVATKSITVHYLESFSFNQNPG